MSLRRVEPNIFIDTERKKNKYVVRWSERGHDRWKQGLPSLEHARSYRKKVEGLKVLKHAFPERITTSFKEAVQLYWDAFKTKGRIDKVRAKGIIDTHLTPAFGKRTLQSLRPEDGRRYVLDRQTGGAAAGTIRREWQVLMRILNLAVKDDLLDRNRLAVVELPDPTKRERVADQDELARIHDVGDPELWRIVTVALNTGLRQGKILPAVGARIQKRDDGPWLQLGKPTSALKRHPPETPLNDLALQACYRGNKLPPGRLFTRWDRPRAFKQYWLETCELAEVEDLTFHDLRHTFATRLQELGIDYEVRQALLGHRMQGMTAEYSHGGPKWRAKLRQAVKLLERSFPLPAEAQAGRSRLKAMVERRSKLRGKSVGPVGRAGKRS